LTLRTTVESEAVSEAQEVKLPHQPCPDGSVLVSGLSLTWANGLAAAGFGTGPGPAVSLFMNWPVAGLYQRAAVTIAYLPEVGCDSCDRADRRSSSGCDLVNTLTLVT
jgi:hypothetical protein